MEIETKSTRHKEGGGGVLSQIFTDVAVTSKILACGLSDLAYRLS